MGARNPVEIRGSFAEVTEDLSATDRAYVMAGADLLGRTGCSEFEIEEGPGGWTIAATWKQNVVEFTRMPSAPAAMQALMSAVLEGGTCVSCRRRVTIVQTPPALTDPDLCQWRIVGNSWESTC